MSIPHRLSAERLRSILSYDQETGRFYWLTESRGGFKGSVVMHRAGDEAGTPRKSDGRMVIRVEGRTYLRYRLAWLWMKGAWPIREIDHMDGDPTNDSWGNLREVSRGINSQNIRKAHRTKKSSELLGVYANKPGRAKPWKSAITVGRKQIRLGEFESEAEAHEAYVAAKRRLHEGCTI